jgi:hypothetical protein|tara:strand:+ start:401 stop:574 length:174 start_codon:yes stop_codon:yes gene_type:complete
MISKIFVTFFLITIFLFAIRFFKKITLMRNLNSKKKDDEDIIDLQKDPKTDEYKPKE